MLLQFDLKRPKRDKTRTYNGEEYAEYLKEYNAWYYAWKATRGKNMITINKGVEGASMVITVYKIGKPQRELKSAPGGDYSISFAANGTAVLTEKDFAEMNQAIAEAKTIL